ncbi:hypothetical protein ACJ73_06427 [Blastomyces percursus]|uniref:Uncharacterized protein n=1 Tax=Blastomyces percursus TaxID=1658174 RepID=A0A1J9R2J2_9EURO|nr:hypothetical protein ACJ73_06427 [Blastomyces percursus]
MLEDSEDKTFPSEAFGKWWPKHFTLNGKAKDAKSAPITAAQAITLPEEETRPLMRTYTYRGRPMRDLPSAMLAGAKSTAIATDQEHLRQEILALRNTIGVKDEEIEQLQQQKSSSEEKMHRLKEAMDRLTSEAVTREKAFKEMEEKAKTLTSATMSVKNIEHIRHAITHLESVLSVPSAKRAPPESGGMMSSKKPRTEAVKSSLAEDALEVLRNMTKTRTSTHDGAGSFDEHQRSLEDAVHETAQEAISTTNRSSISKDSPPLAANDGEIKAVLDLVMRHVFQFGSGITLWNKDHYYDLLRSGATCQQLLQRLRDKGIIFRESQLVEDLIPSATVTEGPPVLDSVEVPNDHPNLSAPIIVPFQPVNPPIHTPDPDALSRKAYPDFFQLRRKAKYLALTSLYALPFDDSVPELEGLAIPEKQLVQAERLFLRTMLRDDPVQIAELIGLAEKASRERLSLEGVLFPKAAGGSPDYDFGTTDILHLTGHSFSPLELKELRRLTFSHLKSENPSKNVSVLGKMLPQSFAFEHDQALFNLLKSKGTGFDEKILHQMLWEGVLTFGIEEALESKLLIFSVNRLSRKDRRQMEDFLHQHLIKHNPILADADDHAIFPASTFTFLELEAYWDCLGWQYDVADLTEGLYKLDDHYYEAPGES